MNKKLRRLAFINRQPTLFRHGIAGVEIIPGEDNVIGISNLMLEPFNMDHDGDTSAIYAIHSTLALQQMYEKAFIQNTLTYDANNEMLAVVRHEALYCAFILTENINPDMNVSIIDINNISELEESDELYNYHLFDPVKINDKIYTYGIVLLNKWCGFDDILINQTITKKQAQLISKTIYNYYQDNKLYYDKLTELDKRLLYFISTTIHCPSINIEEMLNVKDEDTNQLFKKLPNKNVYLGYYINEALIDRCLSKFKNDNSLYKLYKSGSRFSKQQLARSTINIGYSADAQNIIVQKPIKTDLMSGLTADDFFRGSPGSRKGHLNKLPF